MFHRGLVKARDYSPTRRDVSQVAASCTLNIAHCTVSNSEKEPFRWIPSQRSRSGTSRLIKRRKKIIRSGKSIAECAVEAACSVAYATAAPNAQSLITVSTGFLQKRCEALT